MEHFHFVHRLADIAGVAFVAAAAFLQHLLQVIDGFERAAQLLDGHALGVVLDDHSRAFIHLPDIVAAVDANGMGEGSGIVVRTPFLDEFSVLVEFPQHRRDAAAGDALRIGARIDKNVIFGIDVNTDGLAHRIAGDQQLKDLFLVFQFRSLGVNRVGGGLLRFGGNLGLGPRQRAGAQEHGKQKNDMAFHVMPPQFL